MKGLHHVEVWVPDIDEASGSWGWLFERLGLDLTAGWVENEQGFKVEIVADPPA